MITLAEEITVNDLCADTPAPVWVDYDGDWTEAVRQAAMLERAEVMICGPDRITFTVVFSDDDIVYSSPYWTSQIAAARRWLGR